MRSNTVAVNRARTYEGGVAAPRIPDLAQLERQVATCLLFEDTFYAKGSQIAQEIAETAKKVPLPWLGYMARKARDEFKLRHVPLFLLAQMNLRRSEDGEGYLKHVVSDVIQRPDETAELLSIIQKLPENKGRSLKKVIGGQVKQGIARAFAKFDAYQLAKWNRDNEIKLRDVLFLTHPKPVNHEQSVVWKKLVDGTLESPDTWEVALSSGSDKKETWERLLKEKKLGYIALLMNLRNMEEANVDRKLVKKALLDGASRSKALPFRFVSAAKHAPSFADALSDAMLKSVDTEEKIGGATYIVIDVSGSMDVSISNKGTLNRWEAAAALGVLIKAVSDDSRVFTFSYGLKEVRNENGLGLIDRIGSSQAHGGTNLAGSVKKLFNDYENPDRLIVITDEQSHDGQAKIPSGVKGYIINVAPYRPGLETGNRITRINGWSERIVDWIRWFESNPE